MRDETVLVTGGAGFIGSALVRELIKERARVIVYDNMIYGDLANLKGITPKVKLIIGDILSWKFSKTVKENGVDYVFNLAAEPYIPHSYENPEKFIEVNIRGTLAVLTASKMFNVKRVVHMSTSEVYGTAKRVPMDEDHPTLPLSTYAVTKLCADRLSHVLSREQDIPVIIARPFNTYGPRETQPYVIPEIISQVSKQRKLKLGNTNAKRDFTYVDDLCKGLVAVATSSIPNGDVVNIGSGKTYSIEEIARKVMGIEGKDLEIEVDRSRLRPLDVDVLQCDHSKLTRNTGWEPKTDLDQGLRRTIDWYKMNEEIWPWERWT